jgi:hypothetical protein
MRRVGGRTDDRTWSRRFDFGHGTTLKLTLTSGHATDTEP